MAQYVRNILKVYRNATSADVNHGLQWYSMAHVEVSGIASKTGLNEKTVAGVMAALSPNNKWSRNKIDCFNMCNAYANGLDINSFKVSTYIKMKVKAWSILEDSLCDDDAILDRLNGQKIRSFYSNIIGLEEVTIDGHALNIAIGKRQGLTDDKTNIGKKAYRELQAAYVKAAKRVGVKPYELQAITWTTWRRVHGIA